MQNVVQRICHAKGMGGRRKRIAKKQILRYLTKVNCLHWLEGVDYSQMCRYIYSIRPGNPNHKFWSRLYRLGL